MMYVSAHHVKGRTKRHEKNQGNEYQKVVVYNNENNREKNHEEQ
jgi:hypothetical protein